MKKTKIYLDTSVINFLFADDAPEKKEITVSFFNNVIATGIYDVFVSRFVIEEILKTEDENKKKQLLDTITNYPVEIINTDNNEKEIDTLSETYIEKNAIPASKKMDALHVASCVLLEIDYLVSWNYKHLANVNREKKIQLINQLLNYNYPFRIVTPENLFNDEY